MYLTHWVTAYWRIDVQANRNRGTVGFSSGPFMNRFTKERIRPDTTPQEFLSQFEYPDDSDRRGQMISDAMHSGQK